MNDLYILERFHEHACKADDNECWLWAGPLNDRGYGRINKNINGKWKALRAHRVSWMIYRGEIPEALQICHKCDVRNCVNPSHLFLGTQRDNMRDRDIKGRVRRGATHAFAKLTDDDIINIRLLAKTQSHTKIACHYKVSDSNISRIVNRHTWTHIP